MRILVFLVAGILIVAIIIGTTWEPFNFHLFVDLIFALSPSFVFIPNIIASIKTKGH